MKKRLFQSMSLLSILAIALTTLMQGVFFSGELYDAMKHQLIHEAVCMAEAMDGKDSSYLEKVSQQNLETRITLIDEDGTVLFDSQVENQTQIENHNERPEVVEARENGSGDDVRDSVTVGKKTVYYALLLDDGQVLRVAHPMDNLWQNILNTLPQVFLFAAVLLVLALLLVRWLVQKIVVPINMLNLEQPLDNHMYDELSPLLHRISRQNTQIQNQLKELEERQQEFATLTRNMDEGLVIVNGEGYILSINKRAVEIFGLSDDDYTDRHILVVNRNMELQQMIEEGLQGHQREMVMELDGRSYQIMSNPIYVSGNDVQGLVLLLLDVTEKQQQEQLRREFTANVSHELRTPLTAISGYAEIMAQGLVPAENMKPFAEKIYKEANRMITLIADIIQLSQLDENSGQFTREPVIMGDLLDEVVQRLQPLAQQKTVTLTAYAEPVTVPGVRQVLQEILYNLCENAIKYNREGGSVKASVVQIGQHAVIKIVDNGIGIPLEEQPRVFERFYRVDKSHSRIIGGTGLGLSIVKHGVQLHHGEIELESQPGRGTTITVYLPVAE
ncbi:MAG: PAS domain S-box protein [Peptococcaceae bacterium]|nr:PAS domain S-box protein [Peptococcaceae bacterium]